jgi:hypothetical protein
MTVFKTLYHPHFEPPESWLRAMLLFYDTVHSIVPESAEYLPSPKIAMLKEGLEGAFVPLEPTEQDLVYDYSDYYALQAVLQGLAEQGAAEDPVEAKLDRPDGIPRLEFGGVSIHTDKMADMLADDLVRFGLAERTKDPNWLRVDRRAGGLVLSMLASRMARNHPGAISTSSDQEASFAVASKTDLDRDKQWSPAATLAAAILRTEIPANIAELTLEKYIDIRERYREKQEIFHLALDDLTRLYFKQSFESPDQFHNDLETVVTRFGGEMRKLREQRLGRQIRRWTPIALGGVVSLATAAIADPTLAIGGAGITLTLQVLQTAQGDRVRGTNIAQAQALLVELGRDLHWNRNWLSRVLS